jgi:hypothetical protein
MLTYGIDAVQSVIEEHSGDAAKVASTLYHELCASAVEVFAHLTGVMELDDADAIEAMDSAGIDPETIEEAVAFWNSAND